MYEDDNIFLDTPQNQEQYGGGSAPGSTSPSNPTTPTSDPNGTGIITPVGAPATTYSTPGSAWTGTYDPVVDQGAGYIVAPGDYAAYDAAKTTFQVDALRNAGATNIQYNPYTRQYVDADKNPIGTAADNWTQADQDSLTARIQKVLNDPLSTQAAKDLVSMPGYGTPGFDTSLNDGSNPSLLQKVQGLLSLSSQESTTSGSGSTSGGTSVGTQATGSSSGGTTSVSDGGSAINRLIDLASMMYASAGASGGGTGFRGLVAGPIGNSATGSSPSPSSGPSKGLIFVIVLVIGGAGYWYYKKHKRA